MASFKSIISYTISIPDGFVPEGRILRMGILDGVVMNTKRYLLMAGLTVLALVLLPASGALNKISPGDEVFLGEDGLDLTGFIDGPAMIGYYFDPCGIDKETEKDETEQVSGASKNEGSGIQGGTIGSVSYGCLPPEDMPPDDIQKIEDPADFFVDPGIFIGKTREWYLWDGKKRGDQVFFVKEPSIGVRVVDGTKKTDISGESVPRGQIVDFLIKTNMVNLSDRNGYSPADAPFRLVIEDPEGKRLTSLKGADDREISLQNLPVDSPEWYLAGSEGDHTAPGAESGWNTGNKAYEPGEYRVYAIGDLNGMHEKYTAPDGSAYTGKTVTPVKTITITGEKPASAPAEKTDLKETKTPVGSPAGSGSADATIREDNTSADQEETSSSEVQDLITQGRSLLDAKEYDKAIKVLDEALARKPENGEALLNKGYALHFSGRHKEALEIYDQVIGINPDSFGAWNHKAMLHGVMKDYGQAIDAFKEALRIDPKNSSAMANMAWDLRVIGEKKEALEWINKAIQADPTDKGLPAMKQTIENYDQFLEITESFKN